MLLAKMVKDRVSDDAIGVDEVHYHHRQGLGRSSACETPQIPGRAHYGSRTTSNVSSYRAHRMINNPFETAAFQSASGQNRLQHQIFASQLGHGLKIPLCQRL